MQATILSASRLHIDTIDTMITRLLPFILAFSFLTEAQAIGVQFIVANAACGNPVGGVRAIASGGVSPYMYQWNKGATTDSIGGLLPGGYSVFVTDAAGDTITGYVQIYDGPVEVQGVWSYNYNNELGFQEGLWPCPGQCNGGLVIHEPLISGQPPFSLSFAGGQPLAGYDALGFPYFNGFCSGEFVTLQATDALGCTGEAQFQIEGPPANAIDIGDIQGACGGPNGSVTILHDNLGWSGLVYILDGGQNVIDGPASIFGSSIEFTGLPAGQYIARFTWNYAVQPCNDDEPFTIPDLGTDCGTVSGTLFIDHDQDCVQDGNDPPIPYKLISIAPVNEFAITDGNGAFSRNLGFGSFSLEVNDPMLYQICPPASPIPFDLSAVDPLVTIDIADSSLIAMDLDVFLNVGPARPGFVQNVWGKIENLSGQFAGDVELVLTFDPQFSYVAASPVPDIIAGNMLTWQFQDFGAFQDEWIDVDLQLPPDVDLIGNAYTHTLIATSTVTETSLLNNTQIITDTITGSYDPNDKQVRTSPGESSEFFLIGQDTLLNYLIRFQNTGTDTAFTVVVTDTIPSGLDLSTLKIGTVSHPFTPAFIGPRVLQFTFSNILLPDSNTNEAASHGLIAFSLKAELPILAGTVISNNADIFFDFNPPIRTNDASIVATISTSIGAAELIEMSIVPNPASDRVRISSLSHIDRIELWSIDGRLLNSLRVGNDVVDLDLSDYSTGVYTLKAHTIGSGVISRSICVQR